MRRIPGRIAPPPRPTLQGPCKEIQDERLHAHSPVAGGACSIPTRSSVRALSVRACGRSAAKGADPALDVAERAEPVELQLQIQARSLKGSWMRTSPSSLLPSTRRHPLPWALSARKSQDC